MKRILVPLLALVLLCMGITALAEGGATIGLDVNTSRLPVYAPDDPYPAELGLAEQPEGETLQVLVLPVKNSLQLQAAVTPKTEKNRRITLSAENEELLKVKGNTITGLKPGETVLTIASQADPSVTVRFRVLVFRPVARISLTATGKSIAVGENISLTPAFAPEDATLKAVSWFSANEQIATVDENGTVTGVKKGSTRITAVAKDGSNIRASINVKVTQNAAEITLEQAEITVDAGRNAVLKATVLPKETDNKNVVWSSSDESIAVVNAHGRVTGMALGDCEIICASATNGEVQAKAAVHVQQPVTKIDFGEAPVVYTGETAQLTWITEPENASNSAVSFKSSNEKILTVSEDGTVTGVKNGEAYVTVTTKDGSNRKARIKVNVYQHLTGVHMKRKTAYIDLNTASITAAVLEPLKGTNSNMTWESADPSVATAEAIARQKNRVSIRGVKKGETVVTGTTEDGGFQTSIRVKVGDFSHALKIDKAEIGGKGQIYIRIRNVSSDLPITYFKMELEMYDSDKKPVNVNTKDGTNIVEVTYGKQLNPGKSTPKDYEWKPKDYNKDIGFQILVVRIVEYQIDNDWYKTLPKNRQPKYEYNPFKEK